MKIGTLHSVRTHLGNQFNAKMYRIMYEDWEADPYNWMNYFYGENTSRYKLRGLIYNHRTYRQEFADMQDYDLIFLSLNFDTYPTGSVYSGDRLKFSRFVKSVIDSLYGFQFLTNQEVIIGAGNEVFEKRGSVEKVVQTAWDTAMGILNSVNPNIEVCSWNEKIRTSAEKEAFKKVLNNQQHKSVCKYVGIQSLGTEPEIARQFVRLAQVEGYEIIDVELMTTTDRFSEIKTKFEANQLLGVNKVFIGCPHISTELANYDENFKKYSLSINNNPKDKYRIIYYVQQFKDKKESEINKMLGEAIMGTIYKVGTKGFIVKLIQKCLNKFLKDYNEKLQPPAQVDLLVEDGLFGAKTREAVKHFQTEYYLTVDGITGQNTMIMLINYFLKG